MHRGRRANSPFINLSFTAMRQRRNQTDNLSFTLLHELGHQIDWWRVNRQIGDEGWIVVDVRDNDPVGMYCLLTRDHGSRTRTISEHFANVYADYWYHVVAGLRWPQADAANVGGCDVGLCERTEAQVRSRATREGLTLPTDRQEIVERRYDAILSTLPFRGLSVPVSFSAAASAGEHASLSTGVPRSRANRPDVGPRRDGTLGMA